MKFKIIGERQGTRKPKFEIHNMDVSVGGDDVTIAMGRWWKINEWKIKNIYWNKPHFTKERNINQFQTNTDRHTQVTVCCKPIMVLENLRANDDVMTSLEEQGAVSIEHNPHQN